VDTGFVTLNGSTVTLQPDPQIVATYANNFTGSAGLAACPFTPVPGAMQITANADGSLSGAIDVVGYGGAFCRNSEYRADIVGQHTLTRRTAARASADRLP
jgi:hypothetical protein